MYVLDIKKIFALNLALQLDCPSRNNSIFLNLWNCFCLPFFSIYVIIIISNRHPEDKSLIALLLNILYRKPENPFTDISSYVAI